MTASAAARYGPYELLSLIGVGGMGEVYRARDTRLDRLVAIKVLHPELNERPERRARFEIEARAISSLSHPHICALFDVGEQDGRAFLVMEYLDGETVDDRLARGPLPLDHVVRYAMEISDALDHAHRERITHRDLKPSNVMLTASGVKLLDFGLAKGPALAAATTSSTLSFEDRKLTADGTMVGTFQYMAPEQLEGKPADCRTDVFALGTVIYEMATGRKAFDGSSQASLIAAILTEQPPPLSSPERAIDPRSPLPALDHIVQRCLAKDPDERWQTARDVRLELEWISKGRPPTRSSTRRHALRPREAMAWGMAALGLAASAWLALGRDPEPAAAPTRFVVSAPSGTTIGTAENRTRIAISPDGRRLAMLAFAEGKSQLWLQSLDSVTAQPLAGTEGAVSPFWSPDSRFIGFFSPGDGELKKVDLTGGPVRSICRAQIDGAPVWGRDGTILFTEFPGGGIHRVAADGGTSVAVTRIDKSRNELNHYWPQFLPDNEHFLYMATGLDNDGLRATPSVYIASLTAPGVTLLTRMHSRMTVAPSDYLLFVQEGSLLAQKFDLRLLQLTGEPIQVANGLGYFRTLGNAGFSISSNGVLAYQGPADPLTLTWFDRSGKSTDSGWPAQAFGSIRLSPDGQRLSVDAADPKIGTSDIWIYDVARGAPVRLTADLTNESGPVWSADGRRVLFRWERGGSPNLYARTISSGSVDLMVSDPSPLSPEDWSPDGRWIAYVRNTRQTGLDLWLKSVDGDPKGKPEPFAVTRFEEWGARFSPDSRWVAFASTESGTAEVYVAPPTAPGDKRRISIGGGTTPRWRADGRELFYASPDNRSIMSVAITPAPTLIASLPTRLFSMATAAARDRGRNTAYDVTPDGQRFLMTLPAGDPSSSRVTVVLNWTSALPR